MWAPGEFAAALLFPRLFFFYYCISLSWPSLPDEELELPGHFLPKTLMLKSEEYISKAVFHVAADVQED